MNRSNWIKVQEGNYDNDKGSGVQNGSKVTKVQLGVGEFYDNSGHRTYGSGKAIIPPTARETAVMTVELACFKVDRETFVTFVVTLVMALWAENLSVP